MQKFTLALFSSIALLMGSTPLPNPPSTSQELSKPYADFGFDVLRDLTSAQAKDNVFISPYSIAVSLAMLSNGANGTTKEAILKSIHSQEQSSESLNSANQALIHLINSTSAVQLAVANGLWIEQSAALNPQFTKTLQSSYSAEAQNLDFRSPAAAQTINGWVAQHTNGRIPKIVDQTDPSTMALLTNAITFKGKWSLPFDQSRTKPHDFKNDRETRKVPMMENAAEYSYSNDSSAESIRLPYADGTFAMYVVLPHDPASLPSFVQGLTAEKFSAQIGQLRQRKGTIELPRFSLTYDTALNSTLSKLGMGIAFRNGADFSGIPERPAALRISDVEHASFLKVDEEGTEAAAATSIGIRATAVRQAIPPFHMVVDHPFFLAIRDERSGQILFMGVVMEPKE
jgi:serine protease inhibitor